MKRPVYLSRFPRKALVAITPGSKCSTTLDCCHSYWQIPLNINSAKLTGNIPYMMGRLLYVIGPTSAGNEQNHRDDAPRGISNMQKVLEDAILYDHDLSACVNWVRSVLQQYSDRGITHNHQNSPGYSPDDYLVSVLRDFPILTDTTTDIHSFCGNLNHLTPNCLICWHCCDFCHHPSLYLHGIHTSEFSTESTKPCLVHVFWRPSLDAVPWG